MPWELRSDPPPHETHESYWRLPVEQRRSRERELDALPRSLGVQDSGRFLRIESQQPPLSYWLMAVVYAMVASFAIPARVFTLRVLNLLLASVAVPGAWVAARRVFGANSALAALHPNPEGAAVATAAVVALMPEVMFDSARVANSGLAIALYSLLAVLCIGIVDGNPRSVPWMGLVLGFGLITKAFFLTAVPAMAGILAWAVWKRRTRLRSALVGFGLAVAVSAWWYARNLRVTGSLSGVLQDAALHHMPLAKRLARYADVKWLSAVDSTFFSHIWFGGWSFLMLRAWIYHFMAILCGFALLGLALAELRRVPERRYLSALAAVYFFFCVGLAYHVLITFLANGISTSAGWYLCAVVVPETVLLAAGLRTLTWGRVRRYVVGGVAFAFAMLDLYGMLFVAVPYYTGLIGHKPGGFLEAFHLARIADMGLGEVLGRIATNKPFWIGPVVVAATGCAYIGATMTLAVIAVVIGRREK
jgi:4-amino-4-deoxy-L-arabinose transferase-like glycosyltransferase